MGILDKLLGKEKAHSHGHATMTAEAKLHIDPVCKMQVDEAKAAAKSEYKGQTYYFCAAGGKDCN